MKIAKGLCLVCFAAVSLLPLMAGGQADSAQASGGKTTIFLSQSKIEIDQALRDVTARYSELHPDVEFVIESLSDNYTTSLRTKFAGGEAPDIFMILGGSELDLWQSRLEDLSDQPWVSDMVPLAKEGISTADGMVYGFPVSVEGYGYVYNKRLFAEAGITSVPKTFTELQRAVEKLKQAGIQPLAGTYMDWYQAGMFLVNMGIARQPDPLAFIQGLNDGSETFVGNEIFEEVANFILYDFSQCESPLNTGFNQQTALLYSESIAMTLGGNWLQPSIDSANPDMQVGLIPMPISDDVASNDKLYAGVTGYWVINKESPAKEEAKAFLTWLATSEEGRKAMTDQLLFIPAFTSFEANPDKVGALSSDLSRYASQGKVYGIYNSMYPAGGAEYFGNAVQKLVAGKLDVPGFLEELQTRWDQLKR
ncbi:ABC transporter substrate-binding protein [Sediminispirochaeta bajacaliforniensis]|uniref:ABC transporter substrate-binding protein n=1 Tax=Sediminispirochaeta bajacaliforniensis TaxID=148 RepID=UPI000380286E|nr:ABC transporter substrate-binding protein [Sediminispirochaeta bajacaliforniensis]